jgi:hypothetical protein
MNCTDPDPDHDSSARVSSCSGVRVRGQGSGVRGQGSGVRGQGVRGQGSRVNGQGQGSRVRVRV